MVYKGFEDLEVWQKSKQTAVNTVFAVKFMSDRKLKEQMRDAAFSISANIAEGYERKSVKDKLRFFGYSKGSASELKSHIQISAASGLIDKGKASNIVQDLTSIGSMLAKLIQYYETLL